MPGIDLDALRSYYASLTDEALLEIDPDDLVEAARSCWDQEIIARRLATEVAPAEPVAAIAPVSETLPVVTKPPSTAWKAVVGRFFLHTALAIFGTSAFAGWISAYGLWRPLLLNAALAAALGYFVFGLRPALEARWTWIVGLGWLGIGWLRGFPLLPPADLLEETLNASWRIGWAFYTLPSVRLAFYALGAGCYSLFPIPGMNTLSPRPAVPGSEQPMRSGLPGLIAFTAAFAGHGLIAVFVAAFVGNYIHTGLILLLSSTDMTEILLTGDLAYALGAFGVGIAAHRWWPSAAARWLWVAGLLWLLVRVFVGGSLPAGLAPARGNDLDAVTDWSLYTSVSIRAAFYSLGAWVHLRHRQRRERITDTLAGVEP